jgi:hypothetical protein
MTAAASFAGQVLLHPGMPLPTIASSRPLVAERLAVGRAADQLPQLLGAVFTLCAMPHRLAAGRAVDGAQGRVVPPTPADLMQLRASQAREQILRISHDWPQPAAAGVLLRGCPLWQPALDGTARLSALPGWIDLDWLGMPAQHWLAAHAADPVDWAADWCQGADSPVARVLRGLLVARSLATPATSLELADDQMPVLARRMAAEAAYCARPDWQGDVPDTGPWSRRNDPVRLPADTAWSRLVSRVVDVLRLAAPGGDHWLAHGAAALAPGEGMAWVEMARGLLVHWVRLVPGPDGPRVAACRVLAPTEWNFHPRGNLAQALAALHGPAAADRARILAIAFDPCVAFDVAESEVQHA